MTKAKELSELASAATVTSGNVALSGGLDVDGVTDLDVVDIDGAANFAADVTFANGADIITASAGTSNFRAGVNAGNSIASGGNYNVVVGDEAGTAITTGTVNTFVGYASGDATTTSGNNVGVGYASLGTNILSSKNVALGNNALKTHNLASAGEGLNVAVGHGAGEEITTGVQNTLIGGLAGDALTTGSLTAVGYSAGGSATTSVGNVFMGELAGGSVTTGANNTAVGSQALSTEDAHGANVAIGHDALRVLNAGADGYNVAVGWNAGLALTTGTANTFLGAGSGESITTGSKNVVIGPYSGNAGGLDIRTSDNNIVLSDGDGNPQVHVELSGNVIIKRSDYSSINAVGCYNDTTGSAANLHIAASGSFVRSTSSLRYKNTVNDATHGLTELMTLRAVTYKGNNDGDTVFGGLIAEEVHDAGLTEFVQYNDDGEPDALAYSNMVSLCIKAIQEQQATITALTDRITALEGA